MKMVVRYRDATYGKLDVYRLPDGRHQLYYARPNDGAAVSKPISEPLETIEAQALAEGWTEYARFEVEVTPDERAEEQRRAWADSLAKELPRREALDWSFIPSARR